MTGPNRQPAGRHATVHRRGESGPATRRLRRSTDNRALGGVIGGMAEFLDGRAGPMRLVFLLSIPLSGGITLLVYLILWMLLPGHRPQSDGDAEQPR